MSTPDCWHQHVTVYSGIDGMSTWKQLSKLCRHNDSSTELTASNFAKINFVSGFLGNRTGFSLTVERGNKKSSLKFFFLKMELN